WAGDLLVLQANQGKILEADLPRFRAVDARQSIEERALTRAVRSDQRGDHSLFQFKTRTRERLQAAEPLGYVAEFQQGHVTASGPPAAGGPPAAEKSSL